MLSFRKNRQLTKPLSLLLAALVVHLSVLVLPRTASTERTWIPEQARLPIVRFQGDSVFIDNVRDFVYTAPGKFTPRYTSKRLDLNKLTRTWFILTPFSKRFRGAAHSFVTFGFSDSQFLSISVEARREPGEVFSPTQGLLRRFEVLYVIGTEPDLIGQRAVFADYPVYLYPVKASIPKQKAMLRDMLVRAETLRNKPEFYNTLTNNCTSNIVSHVNAISPHKVPSGWKTVFPGYIDEVALRLGLIAEGDNIAKVRQTYQINAKAKKALGQPDFSYRIRQ